MSLRRCLESLPMDADSERTIEGVLAYLSRRPGVWIEAANVLQAAHSDVLAQRIVGAFLSERVIEADESGQRYRFAPDRLLRLEVETYLRRSHVRTGMVRDNVARFRERYGR